MTILFFHEELSVMLIYNHCDSVETRTIIIIIYNKYWGYCLNFEIVYTRKIEISYKNLNEFLLTYLFVQMYLKVKRLTSYSLLLLIDKLKTF